MEWRYGEYVLTDDPARLDVDACHELLRPTYWANTQPREITEKSLRHSLCFSLFHHERQIGLTRVVTDFATFAWICDVIIHPDHRDQGLGKWMMECVVNHPDLQIRCQLLRTRDAHRLYEKLGFRMDECLIRRPLA